MYKTTLLSGLCLLSTVASAQIGIDLNINIEQGQRKRQIQQTVIVDENVPVVVEDRQLVVHVFAAKENNDDARVETKIFEKVAENELELIASPILLVKFGKTGQIKLGKETGDQDVSSLIIEISPSLIQEE